MGVFEGKVLYFCGGGGGWLFFNPVDGCLSCKCNSVGDCPSQKGSSVGILHSCELLRFKNREMRKKKIQFFRRWHSRKKNKVIWVVGMTNNLILWVVGLNSN